VKDITQTANVYQTGTVAEGRKQPGKLLRARFIGPLGDADEEVIAGLADVAAVNRARRRDRRRLREMVTQHAFDLVSFGEPALRAGPRDHRAAWRNDRRVFDKG